MSDYFDPLAVTIAAGTRALAAQVNAVTNLTSAAFDKLPTETELKLGLTRYAVDTGVADAYIVTLPYVPVLTDGFNFTFKAVNANTGASTINVNGTGVKSIVNTDGTSLIANTFGNNAIVILAYELSNDRYLLISQNPAFNAQASASAAAALVSEGNAATSETNALASETNAAASYDSFDDRYLGPKATPPTLDNDGDPLIDGALYWNTAVSPQAMRAWDGNTSQWEDIFVGGAAATISLATEAVDAENFVVFANAATGSQAPKTNAALRFNALTGDMIAPNVDSLYVSPAAANIFMSNVNALDGDPSVRFEVDTTNADHDFWIGRGVQWTGTQWQLAVTGDSPAGLFLNGAGTNTGIAQLAAGNHNGQTAGFNLGRPEDWTPGAALRVSGNVGVIDFETNGVIRARVSDTDFQIDDLRVSFDSDLGPVVIIDAAATTTQVAVTAGSNLTSGDLLNITSNLINKTGQLVNLIQEHASSTADGLTLRQDGSGGGIDISHLGTNGVALNVTGNNASRTNDVATITQANASSLAIALQVQQDGNSTALLIDKNGTGAGSPLSIANEGTSAGIQVTQNGIATGVSVQQNSTGTAISATSNDAASKAGVFTSNIATRTQPVVEIINENATGAGVGAFIRNDQTGYGLHVQNTTTTGIVARFEGTVASRTQPVVEITHNASGGSTLLDMNAGSSGRVILSDSGAANAFAALDIRHAGTGTAIAATATNSANVAIVALSTTASRTVPVMRVVNDNAVGSGVAMEVQQDQSAPHIELTGANGEGIKFTSDQTSTDVNTLDHYEEGEHVPSITVNTGTVTLNTTIDTLAYTRIGRCVHVTGQLNVSSVSTPSGVLQISLPFAIGEFTDEAEHLNSPVYVTGAVGVAQGYTLMVNDTGASTNANIEIVSNGNDAGAEMQAGTTMYFNFHYFTD